MQGQSSALKGGYMLSLGLCKVSHILHEVTSRPEAASARTGGLGASALMESRDLGLEGQGTEVEQRRQR